MPPGLLISRMTPLAFLLSKASYRPLIMLSAPAGSPGMMPPDNFTMAVCFSVTFTESLMLLELNIMMKISRYAKPRNLKKMLQRRERFCSLIPASAISVIASFSQLLFESDISILFIVVIVCLMAGYLTIQVIHGSG